MDSSYFVLAWLYLLALCGSNHLLNSMGNCLLLKKQVKFHKHNLKVYETVIGKLLRYVHNKVFNVFLLLNG